MKEKLLSIACLAAAMTFTSCSDDSEVTDVLNEKNSITFVAECPSATDTRGIQVDENHKVTPAWKGSWGGDFVRLYLSNHTDDLDAEGEQIFYPSLPLPEGTHKTGTFAFDDVDLSDPNADYIAIVNSCNGRYSKNCIYPEVDLNEGTILFKEGENGHETGNDFKNYDNSREILVSKTGKIGDLKSTDNTLEFKRLTSMLHLHIKNLERVINPDAYYLVSIKLKSVEQEEKYTGFTGSISYNIKTGEIKREQIGRNVGIIAGGVINNEQDLHFYTNCMPTELLKGTHLRLELELKTWDQTVGEDVVMEREVKENIKLEPGFINTFVFNIEDADIKFKE